MAKDPTLPANPLFKFISLRRAFSIVGKYFFPTWTGKEIDIKSGNTAAYKKKKWVLNFLLRAIKDCHCFAYYENEVMQRVPVNMENAAFIHGLYISKESWLRMGRAGELHLYCEIDRETLENYLNTKWPKHNKLKPGPKEYDRKKIKEAIRQALAEFEDKPHRKQVYERAHALLRPSPPSITVIRETAIEMGQEFLEKVRK